MKPALHDNAQCGEAGRGGPQRPAPAGAGLNLALVALALALGGCGPGPTPTDRASTSAPSATTATTDRALGAPAPAYSASMPGPSAMSGAVNNASDIEVTNHVQSALNQDDALRSFNIGVITLKGDVRLSGMVDTQSQIDAAVRIARAAEGAHSIHDELTLKPRTP